MELEREEATRRRCEAELAELAAGKMAAAKVQNVQQHRLQSLRKIQLCAWRQQVQDHMDVIRLCFQKWVGGGGHL